MTSAPAHLFEVAPTDAYAAAGGGFGGRGSPSGRPVRSAAGMIIAYEDRRGPDGRIRRIYLNAGQNPPGGVLIEYYLKQPPRAR